MAKRRWSVVFGAESERDLATILAWTTERFGERQARVYKETLLAAVRAWKRDRRSSAPRLAMTSAPG